MENSNNLIKKLDSAINKIRNENVILSNKPYLIWSYLLRILNTRKKGRFNSSYVKVNNDNNRIITIRFSNHPANESNFLYNNAEGDNISIVISKKERTETPVKQSPVYQEIVYPISLFKKSKKEVVTEILYGIKSALECGEYKSKTGKFMGFIVVHRSIPKSLSGTSDRQRRMRMYKYKLNLLNICSKRKLSDFGEKIGGSAKDRYNREKSINPFVLPNYGDPIPSLPSFKKLTEDNNLTPYVAFEVLSRMFHYDGYGYYAPDKQRNIILSYSAHQIISYILDNAEEYNNTVSNEIKNTRLTDEILKTSHIRLIALLKTMFHEKYPNIDTKPLANYFARYNHFDFTSSCKFSGTYLWSKKRIFAKEFNVECHMINRKTIEEIAQEVYPSFEDLTISYYDIKYGISVTDIGKEKKETKNTTKHPYREEKEKRGYNYSSKRWENYMQNEKVYIFSDKTPKNLLGGEPLPFIVNEGEDINDTINFITSQPYHNKKICFNIYTNYSGEIRVTASSKKRIKLQDIVSIGHIPSDYLGTYNEYIIRNRHELLTKAYEVLYPTFKDKEGLIASIRCGKDWRKGRNADEQDFLDIFGFRAVEFGETMPQKERHKNMNLAYDSFMDLANILRFPVEAIGLGGRLALCFGSRGRGGRGAAMAHYERKKEVINLTRNRGAGSLAHEWFHALDHSLTSNDTKFASELTHYYPTPYYSYEAKDNMLKIESILKKSKMFSDSERLQSSTGQKQNGKGYWTQEPELFARAFEGYLYKKLQSEGQTNEYLVQIPIKEDDCKIYPYPHNEDMSRLSEAFDYLFKNFKFGKHTGVERNVLYGA